MNLRDSILVALPALLVGLGAGYAFSSSLADSGASSSRNRSATRAPAAGDPAPPAPAERAEDAELVATPRTHERGVAAAPVEASAPRVSESRLAEALDAVAAPSVAPPRGAGTITGFVRDAEGAPVAGVTVLGTRYTRTRWSDPARVGRAAPEDESLEEHLRDAAEDWAETRAGRRRAVTGADGAYVLTGIEDGRTYHVSAYLEGFALDPEGSSSSLVAGSRLDFTADAVHAIGVRLVGPDGRPVEEGLVRVGRGRSHTSYAWSPDEPELRVTAGRVTVRGLAGVDPTVRTNDGTVSTLASEERTVDVLEQAGRTLELVLEPRPGIVGRVVGLGEGDQPQARLLPVPSGGEVDLKELASSNTSVWLQGGRFAFLDLAPGTYAVGLASWNEPVVVHAVVEVARGLVEVELAIPEPDPERTLVVRATGPDGRALRDLDFRWQQRSARGSRSGGIAAERRPDGAYALRPREEYFEPWGEETSFTLTVVHAVYGARPIELSPGQLAVDVAFEEPVSLVLIVENHASSGYEGRLQANVGRVEGGSTTASHMVFGHRGDPGRIGADGTARFDTLSPGEWRITLNLKTGEWQYRPIATRDVTLASGETTVRMAIPALYDVAVFAPELDEGAWMQLWPKENGGGTAQPFGGRTHGRLDADRRLVFEGVAAGEYVLRGNGLHEGVPVTVPCGEVLVEAQEPDCFRVSIGDLDGLLYAQGLRAGDLVIGADGELFESASKASFLYEGEGETTLIVDRGGEELTVAVPRGLGHLGDLGGRLSPAMRP